MSDHLFNIAVLIDELGSGFVADAGNAGKIVGGFTFERDKVYPLAGDNTVTLEHGGGVIANHVGDSTPGHDHRYAVAHELQNIPIAGDDDNFISLCQALLGKSSEQVVGFISVEFDQRNLQRLEDLSYQRKLLPEDVGCL